MLIKKDLITGNCHKVVPCCYFQYLIYEILRKRELHEAKIQAAYILAYKIKFILVIGNIYNNYEVGIP